MNLMFILILIFINKRYFMIDEKVLLGKWVILYRKKKIN